jgi:hypothetical protein
MATEELTPLDGAAAPTGSPMDGLAWAETLRLDSRSGRSSAWRGSRAHFRNQALFGKSVVDFTHVSERRHR